MVRFVGIGMGNGNGYGNGEWENKCNKAIRKRSDWRVFWNADIHHHHHHHHHFFSVSLSHDSHSVFTPYILYILKT